MRRLQIRVLLFVALALGLFATAVVAVPQTAHAAGSCSTASYQQVGHRTNYSPNGAYRMDVYLFEKVYYNSSVAEWVGCFVYYAEVVILGENPGTGAGTLTASIVGEGWAETIYDGDGPLTLYSHFGVTPVSGACGVAEGNFAASNHIFDNYVELSVPATAYVTC